MRALFFLLATSMIIIIFDQVKLLLKPDDKNKLIE